MTLTTADSRTQLAEQGFVVVEDVFETHARMVDEGYAVTNVTGDPEVCLFFSMRDPDGNVLLICDR